MDKELLKNKVRYLYNKWLNQKAKEIFIDKMILKLVRVPFEINFSIRLYCYC